MKYIRKCNSCNGFYRHGDGMVPPCPVCGSTFTRPISPEEWRRLQPPAPPRQAPAPKQAPAPQGGIHSQATPETLIKRAKLFLEEGNWASAEVYAEACLDLQPENAEAYLCKLLAGLRLRREEDLAEQMEPFDQNPNYQKVLRFGGEEMGARLSGYNADIRVRNEQTRLAAGYARGLVLMENAETEGVYQNAAKAFMQVRGYKDADVLAQKCLERAQEVAKDRIYFTALHRMQTASGAPQRRIQILRSAICLFSDIPDWKDAQEKQTLCSRMIRDAEEEIAERERRAEEARLAMEADIAARKERSRKAFKRFLWIALPIAALLIIGALLLFLWILPEREYQKIEDMIEEGDIASAVAALEELDTERSRERLETLQEESPEARIYLLPVGETFTYGALDWDGDGKADPIEWRILDRQEGQVLVLSEQLLYMMPYHSGDEAIESWAECSLRNWLDDGFYNKAFTKAEQKWIAESDLYTFPNDVYDVGMCSTKDSIFLLSFAEYLAYMDLIPTEATSVVSNVTDQSWYLRTMGETTKAAMFVDAEGDYTLSGENISNAHPVRPAMWMDFNG